MMGHVPIVHVQYVNELSRYDSTRLNGNSSNGRVIVLLQKVQAIRKGLVGFLVDRLADKECQLVGILARSWNTNCTL